MIRMEDVSWKCQAFALEGVNLEVEEGSYGVLMGTTGCGKTTLLEFLCGLREPDEGRMWIGELEVTDLAPRDRRIGYVPQDGALFPAMKIRDQLGFAAKLRGESHGKIREQVEDLAEVLSIGSLLDRTPEGLSGGERQRVALGRALGAEPKVLLLDEPLSALDESMRESMMTLLKSTREKYGLTVLHVTHSRWEAESLATRRFEFQQGKVTVLKSQSEVSS